MERESLSSGIHSLPDDILKQIVKKVNKEVGNDALFLMEVSKRWHRVVKQAVSRLVLPPGNSDRALEILESLAGYEGLNSLKIETSAWPAVDDVWWLAVMQVVGPGVKRLTLTASGHRPPSLDLGALLGHVTAMRSLSLQSFPLPDSMTPGSLTRLTQLCASAANSMATGLLLPSLTALVHLRLHNCLELNSLPSLSPLLHLRLLDISGCSFLLSLGQLRDMPELAHLKIQNCISLTELTPLCNLPKLQALNVSLCPSLGEAPGLVPLLTQLTALTVFQSLRTQPMLPCRLRQMSALECLDLDRFDGHDRSAEAGGNGSLDGLTALRSLSMVTDNALAGALGALPSLTNLRVHDCPHLCLLPWLATPPPTPPSAAATSAPHDAPPISHLLTCTIKSCRSLGSAKSLEAFPSLQSLTIVDCFQLTSLPCFSHLPSLSSLSIDGCPSIADFQLAHIRDLHNLTQLSLSVRCSSVFFLAELPRLRSLTLRHCAYVTELPPLNPLAPLTSLCIEHCPILFEIPPLNSFSGLRSICVTMCPQITALPPLTGMSSLHTILVSGCKIKSLPSLQGCSALRSLSAACCDRLTVVPSLEGLTALTELKFCSCRRLGTLPPVDALTSLRVINLKLSRKLKDVSLPQRSSLRIVM